MYTLQFNPTDGAPESRMTYSTREFVRDFQDGGRGDLFKTFKRRLKEEGITWKQAWGSLRSDKVVTSEGVQTEDDFASFMGPLWLGTIQNATLSGATIVNAPFVNSYTAPQGPSDRIEYRLYRRYRPLTIDRGDSDAEFPSDEGDKEIRYVHPLITGDRFVLSQAAMQDLPIEMDRLNLESISTLFPLTYQHQIIDALYNASSGADETTFENVGQLRLDAHGRVPFSEILREKLIMEMPTAATHPTLAQNPTQLAAHQRLFIPSWFLASPRVYRDLCANTLLQYAAFFRDTTILQNGNIGTLLGLEILPVPTGSFNARYEFETSDDCYLISPLAGIDLVYRAPLTVDSWITHENRRVNWQVYSRQGSFVRVPYGIRRLTVGDEYSEPADTVGIPMEVVDVVEVS